jgi:hypothetical protein
VIGLPSLTSLLSWRVWAVAGLAGLALHGFVVTRERDRANERAGQLSEQLQTVAKSAELIEANRAQAVRDRVAAEQALASYSDAALDAFENQAETARRLAVEVAQLRRRLDAANQEIADADPSLRLDDPLPDSLRDALACAGGDAAACATASAHPGGMPVGADGAPGPADAAPHDADGARGAPDRGGRPGFDGQQREPGRQSSGVRLGAPGPAEA